jgi:DNA-binding response OmpR family regulator
MRIRVGIVEDEERTRRLLTRSLESERFEVVSVEHPEQEEALAVLASLDIVILDLMLGDTDGLSVLRSLRRHSSVPVIVVTARDDLDDKVASLRTGADDYVVKPYSVEELVARMEAVLRRHVGLGTDPVLRTGALEVFLESPRVRVAGKEIELTRKEYGVIELLASNLGRVVVSDAILARVWGDEYIGYAATLHVTVSRLRAKLGEARHLLETRPGVGYCLRRTPPPSEGRSVEVEEGGDA